MHVAALYDIHGNLPALRAVLADVEREGVSEILVGGDVAAGPLPAETIDLLASLGERVRFVRGNADREVVEAFDRPLRDIGAGDGPAERAAVFAASCISRGQRDLLASFSDRVVTDIAGLGPVLFCHGSPHSDVDIITKATPELRLRQMLAGVAERLVICGHTHQQFDRYVDRLRIVNAGSVGVPYEGRPGAFWALLGPDVVLRRTDYDIAAAVVEMRAGGFPDVDDMLQDSLIKPLAPDEVADFFEDQAAG